MSSSQNMFLKKGTLTDSLIQNIEGLPNWVGPTDSLIRNIDGLPD
jgi:hypothetical protein